MPNHQQLLQLLHDYGLSDKESLIYLTLLELGTAPASTIGRKAELKRSTTYAILQDMTSKGIVQKIDNNQSSVYVCLSPQALMTHKQQQHDRLQKNFDLLMPDLLALHNKALTKPHIRYLEGLSGVKQSYEELLSSSQPLRAFFGPQIMDQRITDFLNHDFLPRRAQQQLHAQVIHGTDTNIQTRGPDYAQVIGKYTDFKCIDHPLFQTHNQITIYDQDNISCTVFDQHNMFAVIITNTMLAHTLGNIFDYLRATH